MAVTPIFASGPIQSDRKSGREAGHDSESPAGEEDDPTRCRLSGVGEGALPVTTVRMAAATDIYIEAHRPMDDSNSGGVSGSWFQASGEGEGRSDGQ